MPNLNEIVESGFHEIGLTSEISGLMKSFIDACIMDSFWLHLNKNIYDPTVDFPRISLLAQVKVNPGTRNIEKLILYHNLNDKRDVFIQTASRTREHILRNCTSLTFQNSYLSNREEDIKAHRYHQQDKKSIDVNTAFRTYYPVGIALLVGGGMPGLIGTYAPNLTALSSNIHVNAISQFLIWGGFSAAAAYLPIRYTIKEAKSKRKISNIDRGILGLERVTEDKISLEDIGKKLGKTYEDFIPPTYDVNERGTILPESRVIIEPYSGLKANCRLQDREGLKLDEWGEANPSASIFRVALTETKPYNIIFSGMLQIEIDKKIILLNRMRSYSYAGCMEHYKSTTEILSYRRSVI